MESGIIRASQCPSTLFRISSLHSYHEDSTTLACEIDWMDIETTSKTFLFLYSITLCLERQFVWCNFPQAQ